MNLIWKCSRCGACCKLVRCNQFDGKGCRIYASRPFYCRVSLWNKIFHKRKLQKACAFVQLALECLASPDCGVCRDTGYCDYDVGGGNVKKGYCKCPAGDERMDRDEALADDYWDRKLHEKYDEGCE